MPWTLQYANLGALPT